MTITITIITITIVIITITITITRAIACSRAPRPKDQGPCDLSFNIHICNIHMKLNVIYIGKLKLSCDVIVVSHLFPSGDCFE